MRRRIGRIDGTTSERGADRTAGTAATSAGPAALTAVDVRAGHRAGGSIVVPPADRVTSGRSRAGRSTSTGLVAPVSTRSGSATRDRSGDTLQTAHAAGAAVAGTTSLDRGVRDLDRVDRRRDQADRSPTCASTAGAALTPAAATTAVATATGPPHERVDALGADPTVATRRTGAAGATRRAVTGGATFDRARADHDGADVVES